MVGENHNAHTERNAVKEGVNDRYVLRNINVAGKDLLGWCEEQGMCYANSFSDHLARGTW